MVGGRRVVRVEEDDRGVSFGESERVRVVDFAFRTRWRAEGRGVDARCLLLETEAELQAVSLDRESDAADLAPGHGGHVQVEPGSFRQEGAFLGRPDQTIDYPHGKRGAVFEVLPVARFAFLRDLVRAHGDRGRLPQTDGDRRRAHGSRHRCRRSGVGARVGPRDQEVEGRFWVGHCREPEEGARRGRGVGAVLARGSLHDADGTEGHRGAAPASVAFGRDDGHAVARPAKRFLERLDPDRVIAVVVGEENVEAARLRARHVGAREDQAGKRDEE